MNPFEMVVLIVAIVMIASVLKARYGVVSHKGKDRYVGPLQDEAEVREMREEVRHLKDRIAVLERIVTDGDRNRGLALEREIEALRDSRREREEYK